jgi:hypothetical protein
VTISLLFFMEAAGRQQRSAYLRPTLLGEAAQQRSEAILLAQRDVIEVHGAHRRHAIFFRQENLSPQSSNGARHGSDDDLVQTVNNFIPREHQNRAALVGKPKCVPAALAADQRNSSHPSASQAIGSSSPENSSPAGGVALYADASVPWGKAIHLSNLMRSASGRDATSRGII